MFRKPAALVVALVALCGCHHRDDRVNRIAVYPFENLSSDVPLDWMGRAAADGLVLSLEASPRIYPFHAQAAGTSTQALRGYLAVREGRLRLTASLEDTAKRRIARTLSSEGPLTSGLLPLVMQLARQLDPGARPPGTSSGAAFAAYGVALRGSDPEAAGKALEQAVAIDPGYGVAHLARVQLFASRGDRAGAEKALEEALQRRAAVPPVERAKLELEAAALHGDGAARRRALEELARLMPASYEIPRDLAEAEVAAHNYAVAVRWYERALALEPGAAGVWNELGYACTYAHNLDGAVRAFERYQKIAPEDPNALDSLGDAHYYLGRFAEAGKYYLAAYGKNAAFLDGGTLLKAARARLMLGDVAGADGLFRRYADAHPAMRDPAIGVKQAQWDYLCGRRAKAVAAMEAIGAGAGPVASHARAQLVVWCLIAGEREPARRMAERVDGTSEAGLAVLVRFLTLPPASASEWAVRAEKTFPEPAQIALKTYALGYALLFAREFAAASPVMRQLYERNNPTSVDPMNVLYAWALVETGRSQEARSLLAVYPLPQPTGESLFAALSFPRQFELRKRVK
jgi:tetratricopeptide (TPR) repeat protein